MSDTITKQTTVRVALIADGARLRAEVGGRIMNQKEHEARIAAMRQEFAERMKADRIKHEKVMALVRTRMAVIEQRNLEGLVAWLEQEATPDQIVTIIGRINRGEWQ